MGAVGAGGCVVDRHADPSQVIEPRTCTVDVALSSDGAATSIPLALDATGSTMCLHLDATHAAAAHFAASTNALAGDSSGVAAVLTVPAGDTLCISSTGSGVPVGGHVHATQS